MLSVRVVDMDFLSSSGPARNDKRQPSLMQRAESGTLPTFDIEGRTFDILILRYRRCNLRYRRPENAFGTGYDYYYYDMTTRYRKFRPSISIASILRTFDIKPLRYRRIFDIEAWSFDIDAEWYRRNIDIEVQNFDIVISRYRNLSMSTNAPSISVYDIEAFKFVLRYWISCSSISVFLCRIQPGLL